MASSEGAAILSRELRESRSVRDIGDSNKMAATSMASLPHRQLWQKRHYVPYFQWHLSRYFICYVDKLAYGQFTKFLSNGKAIILISAVYKEKKYDKIQFFFFQFGRFESRRARYPTLKFGVALHGFKGQKEWVIFSPSPILLTWGSMSANGHFFTIFTFENVNQTPVFSLLFSIFSGNLAHLYISGCLIKCNIFFLH